MCGTPQNSGSFQIFYICTLHVYKSVYKVWLIANIPGAYPGIFIMVFPSVRKYRNIFGINSNQLLTIYINIYWRICRRWRYVSMCTTNRCAKHPQRAYSRGYAPSKNFLIIRYHKSEFGGIPATKITCII